MTTAGKNLWPRVVLGGLLVANLALCSAADPEQDARTEVLQEMIEAERWDDVVAEAGILLTENPDNIVARAKLGLALLGKARNEEQVLDESRFNQAKNADDAAAFFDPSLFRTEVSFDDSLWDKARQEFEKVTVASPENLDALVGLATIHARAGDFDKEAEVVSRAARTHAGDEDAGRRLIRFGERYFATGDYAKALSMFDVLIESFGEDATVILDHGAAQFATGRYDLGITTVERAAALDPEHERILQTLGQMYMFRMRWEEAEKTFETAQKLTPDDAMVTVQRAAALMPENPERAKPLLQSVLDADQEKSTRPGIIAGNLLLAMDASRVKTADLVYLSEDLNRYRQPQLAAAVGGMILVRDPQSVAGRLVMASVYDGLRYFDLSLLMLNDAARTIREHPEASAPFTQTDLVSNFGRTYFRMGDYQKAIQLFQSAENPEVFQFALGLAYENLGDFENAFRAFNKVIEQGKPEHQVTQARVHLQKEEYAAFQNEP